MLSKVQQQANDAQDLLKAGEQQQQVGLPLKKLFFFGGGVAEFINKIKSSKGFSLLFLQKCLINLGYVHYFETDIENSIYL